MNINDIQIVLDKIQVFFVNAKSMTVKWFGRVVNLRPTQTQTLIGAITLTAFAGMAAYFTWRNKAQNNKKPLKVSLPVSSDLQNENTQQEFRTPRTIDAIVRATQDDGEDVTEEDLNVIYKCLDDNRSDVNLEIYFTLPIHVLKKIDVKKISYNHLFWFCFGRSREQHQSIHDTRDANQLYTDLIPIYQSRFESLVGTESGSLQLYCNDPYLTCYFSAAQLKTIRTESTFLKTRQEIRKTKLKDFFPVYTNIAQASVSERERFTALFSAKDVQRMLTRGYFNFSTNTTDFETYLKNWKYHMRLISPDQLKELDFSIDAKNNEFGIDPLQIILMFDPNGAIKLSCQSLNSVQKNQIKNILKIFVQLASRDVTALDFLKKFRPGFVSTINEFFTEKEKKMLFNESAES